MMMKLLNLLAVLSLAGAVPPQPTRNITGEASPLVFPADFAGNLTLVVRGSNFGSPSAQPSDLICRVKVPDFEATLPGPSGPATVINDTAIRCTLTGYLAHGAYGIAVESASNSDPQKKIWWSSGTSSVQFRNLVEATPSSRPYLSDRVQFTPSVEVACFIE